MVHFFIFFYSVRGNKQTHDFINSIVNWIWVFKDKRVSKGINFRYSNSFRIFNVLIVIMKLII